MTQRYGKLLAEITEATVVAQSTDVFAANFKPTRSDSLVRISIAATAVIVSLMGSDGSVIHLNNGTALAAYGIHTEELHLDSTRTWNVQTEDAAGVTARLCTIYEVAM